ncbi:hypothetical protein [Desulfobulbus oligotrophicus]|uniref:Uncharacterized protein n=1 Tax=Desulfobulbus oligotrophicus TaxID=1909699 RepID=A0A7T5VES8_9BACT|nr:hypothetical protein [Desulfobulbus oligotrophicus]QQG66476.1 hypothetical protein HP555_11670 [Desulfobulbus oligotrophicus]
MPRLLCSCSFLLATALFGSAPAVAGAGFPHLDAGYRFLVSDRGQDGILYTATAGTLQGKQLPLSYHDSPAYWGEHVCSRTDCTVIDRYDPNTATLLPQDTPAGDLQTERVNTHNGINIYDGATWQIAVMLGHTRNHFSVPTGEHAYSLVSNQNLLLTAGHSGNSLHPVPDETRAVSRDTLFVYNNQPVHEPRQAFSFRMLPRAWLSPDPLAATRYGHLVTTVDLPDNSAAYQPGLVSWTDWKPITGENAWAFLIGPLQAAIIHYTTTDQGYVPLSDPALTNALAVLPSFAALQSPAGGVYSAPSGTVANQGNQLIDPFSVSVENNISLLAGLKILQATLKTTLKKDSSLTQHSRKQLAQALTLSTTMLNGGNLAPDRQTRGLLAFFRDNAWQDGIFVQGGQLNRPDGTAVWQPNRSPKAVDVNTWGIAALGPATIDDWFGFGAAFRNWQNVKNWGGYGQGSTLWGVGFSDQDGNGIDSSGRYRQGVLSTEWTAGAITMVRAMLAHYRAVPALSPDHQQSAEMVMSLQQDEQSMLTALNRLRLDSYAAANFPGTPDRYSALFPLSTRPYLYASRRYLIPFGWYANPIPSTCATAWIFMVANGYNPFVPGG